MQFLAPVGKGRKPRFDLYLKIYDLNNVPLVAGTSYIKWHLSHSIHTEHRGRTPKCPIVNHGVDYDFAKHVQHIRISVDKSGNLADCPIEFEIIQEFPGSEKITLGAVKLNLSEYVGESESLSDKLALSRKRANSTDVSPTNTRTSRAGLEKMDDGPEGIVRRYLMQDSKVNSTLKMSILMVQVDGDRNFAAPPLKTATTFAGIAGIVAHEQQAEDEAGMTPSFHKSQDTAEIQDLYRRVLAASWRRLPTELPADECIEDVFSGGNGWRTGQDSSSDTSSDEGDEGAGGTLRPADIRRMGHHRRRPHHGSHSHQSHRRGLSASSSKSTATVTGQAGRPKNSDERASHVGLRHSGSMASLGPTLDQSDGSTGFVKEVGEHDVRDDLVAWRLPA